ncbi:MAG: type II toxin-antitoxin system VapC family toxin [Caulobacteraceae bacterium]
MSVYLDAGLLVPTLVERPSSPIAAAFVRRPPADLVVSEFACAEVASALSRLVRMGALTWDDVEERLAAFDAWRAALAPCPIESADHAAAYGLVRRFDLALRAPDALHLALCRRRDHELATLDRRLARAATTLAVRATFLS